MELVQTHPPESTYIKVTSQWSGYWLKSWKYGKCVNCYVYELWIKNDLYEDENVKSTKSRINLYICTAGEPEVTN